MQGAKNCVNHDLAIQFICFDPACTKSKQQIMCSQCTNDHNKQFKSHHVIQYKLVKKYLQTLKTQIEYEELKQIIRDQFSILKKDLNKYLTDLQDSVLSQFSLQFSEEHEQQVFQGQLNLLTTNEIFRKFVTNTSQLNLIKEEVKLKNIALLKQLRSLNEEMKKLVENTQKELSEPVMVATNFVFSTAFKHGNIQVLKKGTCIKRKSKQSLGHSQLCLCKQPFTPMNPKVQFSINEITVRGCISVGACILPIVQKNNFFRSWQLGEGSYSLFMNTFGIVKSNHHSLKQYSNAMVKNWKFKKGDVIKVQIDFMKEKLVFTRNKIEEFTMPIDIGEYKLYPFAALSYLDDEVQIK